MTWLKKEGSKFLYFWDGANLKGIQIYVWPWAVIKVIGICIWHIKYPNKREVNWACNTSQGLLKDCHTRDFAKFLSKQILMISKWCLVPSFMVILQCLPDQILIWSLKKWCEWNLYWKVASKSNRAHGGKTLRKYQPFNSQDLIVNSPLLLLHISY